MVRKASAPIPRAIPSRAREVAIIAALDAPAWRDQNSAASPIGPAPITAMRAVGQAKFRSAVNCLEPITAYAPP